MRRTKMKSCGLTELIVSAYTLCGLGGIIVVEQAYEKKFGTWVITNLLWGLAGGTFAASNLVLALRVWVSGTLERQVDELTDAVSRTLGTPPATTTPPHPTTPLIPHQPRLTAGARPRLTPHPQGPTHCRCPSTTHSPPPRPQPTATPPPTKAPSTSPPYHSLAANC